jgi:hypothetical protein
MVKPRVFVSSTYYDLKHIRNYLEDFLETMGYDPVLFEKGEIPYSPNIALDQSCYEEIKNCHMLILIIGGHYGSPSSEDIQKYGKNPIEYYNSITKKEFEQAVKEKIPIFIFIDKSVYIEYKTYTKNREMDSIHYAHVDNVNIFKLIDEIFQIKINVIIQPFEDIENITEFLREQFAGLFAEYISNKKREQEFADLEDRISDLKEITESLREYTTSIMKKIQPEEYTQIVRNEQRRWEIRKISRFSREPLIEYILDAFEPDIRNRKIVYYAMKESSDLNDFLQKSLLRSEQIDEFLKANSDIASRDYNDLKRKYFGESLDESDEDKFDMLEDGEPNISNP